jgi:hypothetical protein
MVITVPKLLTTLALSLSLALASCAPGIAPPAPAGTVDHIVLIWLKRPGNEQDRKALRDAADQLRSIPGIVFLDHGTPVSSDHPIVDDSFDVAYVMRFTSKEALQAYDPHPDHLKQVENVIRPLSKKVVVYDIVR